MRKKLPRRDHTRISGFGEAVKVAMVYRGWTQKALAEELGIAQQVVSQALRTRNPTLKTVEAFAVALGVQPLRLDTRYLERKLRQLKTKPQPRTFERPPHPSRPAIPSGSGPTAGDSDKSPES